MPYTVDPFNWRTMTAVVNRMRSPNDVLQRLLFPDRQNVPTDTIEVSYLDSGRNMAPFVKVNGAAVMVPGHAESYATIQPANIRISRPFSPYTLLMTRRVGTPFFVDQATQRREMNAHIARDLQTVNDRVVNAREWLCAQAITGTIQYSAAGGDTFRVEFNRSAAHNITLASGLAWDNADKTLPRPSKNFFTVKNLLSEEGLTPTDALLGASAVAALHELAATGNLKLINRDSGILAGSLTMIEQFNRDGLVFLGQLDGIRLWHYNRSVVDASGTSIKLIRDDYVEFFDVSPSSQRVLYHGAIPDWSAIESGSYVGESFSKSWMENDPSTMMYLIHSRPMPATRLPNATVSMKVTNV